MIAEGTHIYTCGRDQCKGSGYSWSQNELDDALASDVGQIIRDDEGSQDCLDIFNDGTTTNFEMERLRSIFSIDENLIKDWQVGEGIACAYLQSHRDCLIPWNTKRDLRTPKGSLPGVDICGVRTYQGYDQLFFCEVKTSSEKAYPPQVASHNPRQGGLAAQVEDLRDKAAIRETVIRYLAYRAKGASWGDRFRAAVCRYVSDNHDISIFGFMVRDVTPDERDLKNRVSDVASNTVGPRIEFLALYLPEGKIATLPSYFSSSQRNGRASC